MLFWDELLQRAFGDEQTGFLKLLACERSGFVCIVIAEDRIMPTFDVQIGIVTGAKQRMDDFRPVRLTETGEAVFSDAVVADAIDLQKLAIDIGVLRMHVKNARAEAANVFDG